ncbi:(deoxy)nucleoside triphosphate pyrophosphohydrolase [Corynebacterium suedekumii]|uniref:8-oxo-dGTP diphosphatase n=1 Tax=Corynebacterium suedekumii TaxID=3049801 RepID=A0ABY8VMN8_9CORY|nr:(deoxy)nucleoside triphosphate pyrophosphohydrolase [Corynebacterium suedekumii]WIM69468.1 (deoxy)nucleoside triphosphate pyrophosphohydrolase [Corynebacterium suedekumii]
MKKRIEVVGAVFTRGDRVLGARRGPGRALPGMWEFPGGKVESGESAEAALIRELHEELRCDATVGDFITTTEYEYDFGTVVLSTYFCTIVSGEPQLTEHQELRWIPVHDLGQVEWAPADIPAVEEIQRVMQ